MRRLFLAIRSIFCCSMASCVAVVAICPSVTAQQTDEAFDVSYVFDQLEQVPTDAGVTSHQQTWWDSHVSNPQRRAVQPVTTDIHSLMYLALKHSRQIRIAAQRPLALETAITEADSNFDWVRYLDTSWNDSSEPVSTTLAAGGNNPRLNQQTFQGSSGLRRNTRTGGTLDVSQLFGWQNSNSTFFVPDNQATSRLQLSYSHPLLRGRGAAYNRSLVVLAQLDSAAAYDNFHAELQNHLLEVARAYWLLYQERASLVQQVKLFLKTQNIVQILKTRQQIDAGRTQLVTASSALETRRADLIRARTAVVNAETRLRGLLNAPELGNADQAEVIPVEFPSLEYFPTDLPTQIQTAIQHRPEAHSALKQVKAASTRLGIAQHEMLPLLNFVAQGYANGLRGDSDFGNAFTDQFSTGRPSYSVGLQYEMPIGNRLARSRLNRRLIERRELQAQYEQALAAIETEVDIALRELQTSHREIGAKSRALAAAETEAETIHLRWRNMIDGNGSSGLNLESLLRAQERVTAAERDYVTSMLTYSLATINLKKSNGTLLQSRNVSVAKTCNQCSGPDLTMDMPQSAPVPQTMSMQQPLSTEPAQLQNVQSFSDQSPVVQNFHAPNPPVESPVGSPVEIPASAFQSEFAMPRRPKTPAEDGRYIVH